MKQFRRFRIGLFAMIASLIGQTAFAQLTLSALGTNYLETFNGIASGLPPGWSVRTNATSTSLGGDTILNVAAVSWASSAGQFANGASTVSNAGTNFTGAESVTIQENCTNRAPAIRQTSSFGDPGAAFVLRLNDTLTLGSFVLDLDFLLLRNNGYSTTWTVDYAIGDSPTNFIPKGTFSDPGAFGATHANIAFGSALDNYGENVWIRIVALNASTGSGSRDTFGIDNVTLSWATNITAVTNPPSIVSAPQNRTNHAGTTASFSVQADGTGPLTYQWRKDGVELSNSNNISGADSPTLNLSSVLKADEAEYTVTITNRAGSTSEVARLTVIDPVIVVQPADRANVAGDTAHFSVTAAGSDPLTFLWFHGAVEMPEAHTASLAITNVLPTSQGNYCVVVSNSCGMATSSVAVLTVISTPTNRIARWDFNDSTAPPTAPTPVEGTGTALLVGGVTATFSSGTACDPALTNSGWNTSDYPAQGTNNLQAGAEFRVSTVGRQNILLSWEQRNTSRASKYARLQYSTNGINFSNHDVIAMSATNGSYVFYAGDLSSIPSVNDNPNFAFRIVTEFESSAMGSGSDTYVPTFGSVYSGGQGTIRFDLVNVYGDAVGVVPPVPPIPLEIQSVGSDAVLTWTNPAFSLQGAPTVTGVYTNVPGASSPYTNPMTGQKFFRLSY